MNPSLKDLLDREGVRYEILAHGDVYTAQERAAACHVSGHRMAKVVVLRDPDSDWHALAVLPASDRLDLLELRQVSGCRSLRLADEAEFLRLFPDCEVGAMPPFGRMYEGLPVFLDASLADQSEIVFEGGTHHEEVRIPMRDYLRIERPDIVPLTLAA